MVEVSLAKRSIEYENAVFKESPEQLWYPMTLRRIIMKEKSWTKEERTIRKE